MATACWAAASMSSASLSAEMATLHFESLGNSRQSMYLRGMWFLLSGEIYDPLAKVLAPNQSTTTAGSSPTTQASWPLGSEVMSPGSATNSVPSSMRIASRPLTWYWKCGASQLAVLAIGLTSLDQRQPGSNTSRPTSPPPTWRISARPLGNSRGSSGAPKLLCSVCCMARLLGRVDWRDLTY